MPRDAQGNYYHPPGTEAVPGETATSSQFNARWDSLKNDLNDTRRIQHGGTGGTTATQARAAIGAAPINGPNFTGTPQIAGVDIATVANIPTRIGEADHADAATNAEKLGGVDASAYHKTADQIPDAAHADTADTATNAVNADRADVATAADDADKLGGIPSSGYLRALGSVFEASDLAEMLASTDAIYPVGSVIGMRSEGYAYEVVASGGDLTTAGGVHLRALPREGRIAAMSLGAAGDGTTDDAAILDALNIVGTVVDLGGRDYAYTGEFVAGATFVNGSVTDDTERREFGLSEAIYRMLNGLEPEKIDGTTLRIQPGSFTSRYWAKYYHSLTAIDIDMTQTGPGGLDAGAPQNGVDYFPYMILEPQTRQISAVLSNSITYGGVAAPAGWQVLRKLPWGFVYRTASGWGNQAGIPDFHLCYWPKPMTSFTAKQFASPFIALNDGDADTWTEVNLDQWLPDNARIAHLSFLTEYTSGAGTSYVRTYGTQSAGLRVGGVNAAGQTAQITDTMRVTSGRSIFYKVGGGVRLSIAVLGYSQTEPS